MCLLRLEERYHVSMLAIAFSDQVLSLQAFLVLPKLFKVGYEPKNIHVSWVLQNYEVAIKNNKARPRVVPEDVLFATHVGAAQTIYNLVSNHFLG